MNAPAELLGGETPSVREAGLWMAAAALVFAVHGAFAYALRDIAPLAVAPAAQEQSMEIDLAPLPVSLPDSVHSDAMPAEESPNAVKPDETVAHAETVTPDDATDAEPDVTKAMTAEAVETQAPFTQAQAAERAENEVVQTVGGTEMAEPEAVDAVNPDVSLPVQAAEAEPVEKAKAAEPPRERPVQKPVRKVERPTQMKEQPKTRQKPDAKIAKKADAGPTKLQSSAASQTAKASKAPTVSPERWNSSVRAAVARSVGRIRGMRGSVSVSFVVTSSGSVASARVSRSSGDGRLDSAAVGAVRAARVPAPPAGLGGSSHAFSIPLSFN